MANPRQRRKLRSGTHKPVQHSRRAKTLLKKQPPIRGPKLLQDSWDKHKTVRQNYEALGLVATLNPAQSGGVERPVTASGSQLPAADASTAPNASSSQKVPSTSNIPKGHGRIIRDNDGNIVDVQMPEEESEDASTGEIEELPDPSQDERLAPWVVGLGSNAVTGLKHGPNTHVVRALEDLSRGSGGGPARFTSTGELTRLRRLVAKHGQDIEAMARDRKLNPGQRTAGELTRAIKKAGGFAEFAKGG